MPYLLIILLFFPFIAAAQNHDMHHGAMNHDVMDHNAMQHDVMPADYHEIETTPEVGKPIKKYVADDDTGAHQNFGVQQTHDNDIFWQFMADRFEYRMSGDDEVGLWDASAWIGGDYNKLYLESEGEYNTDESSLEAADLEVLYSRNVSSFWDMQVGYKHEFIDGLDDRDFAAFGFQGLAPYWIETDATAYISDEGDVSATIEGEYDLLLSQRLVLQPRIEADFALQDVPEYNIGSGINGFETGLRLRYEFSRKFAPYLGVSYEQALGETHSMLENDGEETSNTSFVTGIRFWF